MYAESWLWKLSELKTLVLGSGWFSQFQNYHVTERGSKNIQIV
jgi:hypothetical protein